MREESQRQLIWVLIIGAWVFGLSFGRWGGGSEGVFADFGRAIGIPQPDALSWWQPLVYFPLTVVAAFVFSELFFGAGAILFMFTRGTWDSVLFQNLEDLLSGIDIVSITGGEIWSIFFLLLVFAANLPLCLWASQLGVRRSVRTLGRLRGKPLRPEVGLVSGLLVLLAISLVVGLMGAFAISYT
jgi:hypothetical protein